MDSFQLEQNYRGHAIRLHRATGWSAELTDLESGTLLPTKATASEHEGVLIATLRAHELIDLYVEGERVREVRR